jgi:hypothetical protein
MQLPRFSIRDLIIATTMVAVGLGLVTIAFSVKWPEPGLIFFAFYFGGLILTGAGAMHPFKLTVEGCVIGALLAIINALFPLFPLN